MPITSERSRTTSKTKALIVKPSALASVEGELRYDGTRFSLYDSTGEYDPKVGVGGGLSHQQVLARVSLRM